MMPRERAAGEMGTFGAARAAAGPRNLGARSRARTDMLLSLFAVGFALARGIAVAPRAVYECQAPANAALPTTIPIDVWNNHVYVKACLDGRELDFILDTGAGNTSLDLETAKRLGLRLGEPSTVGGAGPGRVAAARVAGATLRLAGTSIEQPVSTAIDLSKLPPREAHPFAGILGYDFIVRYVVAIDYAKRELRVYDRERFRYDGPGATVPIEIIGRFPHVSAEVHLADGGTARGRFLVDVGSGAALTLTKPFVDENRLRSRVGPTVHRTGGGGVGGATTSDIGRVAALDIGSVELQRPITGLFGDSAGVFSRAGSWVGNIGGAVLRRFTVYFDYQGKRMILEPNAEFGEPFESDMSGASFAMDDSLRTVIVETVAPGTPAAEAGLAAGDTVVSVDGVRADRTVLGELRETKLRRAGERVVMVVRRGGEERRVEFVTRRMV